MKKLIINPPIYYSIFKNFNQSVNWSFHSLNFSANLLIAQWINHQPNQPFDEPSPVLTASLPVPEGEHTHLVLNVELAGPVEI